MIRSVHVPLVVCGCDVILCLSFALYVVGTPTVTVPASERPGQVSGSSNRQAPASSLESSSGEGGGEAAPLTSRQAVRLSEMVASQLKTRTVDSFVAN